MSQQLVKPINKLVFRPNETLHELSQMIRELKSVQITDIFFDKDRPNHRCVNGALAVEFFGSGDDNDEINTVLGNKTEYTKFKYNSVVYNKYIFKSGTYTTDNDIWWKIAHMNNSGRSFSEIADWVELEAYRHGEWK